MIKRRFYLPPKFTPSLVFEGQTDVLRHFTGLTAVCAKENSLQGVVNSDDFEAQLVTIGNLAILKTIATPFCIYITDP